MSQVTTVPDLLTLRNIHREGVSVVICCYNSSERIVPTIKHLLSQDGITFDWEVLLVDNNSTDNTAEVVSEIWTTNNGPCKLRIIKEPRTGTMFARHTGILSSDFRYLLFCDDDNWFHSSYVKQAFETIKRDSSIAAVGGKGVLTFDPGFTPPGWVEEFQMNFGAGPQGKTDGDTTFRKGCLYTAGAILDRVWLDRLYSAGFESSLKGRDGHSLIAGEDTELTYALKLMGGRLHYSSQMHFMHYMPGRRMNWKYLKRMWNSFGYSDFLLLPYKLYFRKRSPESIIKIFLKELILTNMFLLLASLSFFAEGNKNVLKFHRHFGQLKASLSNFNDYVRNCEMVKKLSDKRSAR